MPTLVCSLQLALEPSKPGTSLSLIAPLDRDGRGKHCRPAATGKKRADVESGDWILHRGRGYRLPGVWPYRSHVVADELARSYLSKSAFFRS